MLNMGFQFPCSTRCVDLFSPRAGNGDGRNVAFGQDHVAVTYPHGGAFFYKAATVNRWQSFTSIKLRSGESVETHKTPQRP